jgi:hypothetical protein
MWPEKKSRPNELPLKENEHAIYDESSWNRLGRHVGDIGSLMHDESYHQKPNKLDTTVHHNRGSHWRNNSVKNRSWIRQHTNLPLHSLHYCLSIEKRENLTPTFNFSTPSSSQTNLLTKSPLQQLICTLGTHLQMPSEMDLYFPYSTIGK